MVVFMCVAFVGCSTSLEQQMTDNLSDVRYNIFTAQNENISVSLMSGMRENPYSYDGVTHKKCEFGIITVTLKNASSAEGLSFVLVVDGVEIKGVLEENPYDHTFMTDIEKIIDCQSQVYFNLDGLAQNMIMTCESATWQVQYIDALKIGKNELLGEVGRFVKDNVLHAETYLKIIFDQNSTENPYYWYFGVVGENGENIAVIINPTTAEIITRS